MSVPPRPALFFSLCEHLAATRQNVISGSFGVVRYSNNIHEKIAYREYAIARKASFMLGRPPAQAETMRLRLMIHELVASATRLHERSCLQRILLRQ